MRQTNSLTRRRFLRGAAAIGLLAGLERLIPAYAWQGTRGGSLKSARTGPAVFELLIRKEQIMIAVLTRSAERVSHEKAIPFQPITGG